MLSPRRTSTTERGSWILFLPCYDHWHLCNSTDGTRTPLCHTGQNLPDSLLVTGNNRGERMSTLDSEILGSLQDWHLGPDPWRNLGSYLSLKSTECKIWTITDSSSGCSVSKQKDFFSRETIKMDASPLLLASLTWGDRLEPELVSKTQPAKHLQERECLGPSQNP